MLTFIRLTRRLLLCATIALLGCQAGPGPEPLQAEIQRKLDDQFGEGLFRVEALTRRGSYPYREEGDDRDRVLVYFNVAIRFAKDFKLSNWDQLNVGSLISVLGATPRGVDGVRPEGNTAEDLLDVHGSSAYVRTDEGWQPIVHVTTREPQPEGRQGSEELPHYRKRLKTIAEIGRRFQRKNRQPELRRLEEELDRVLSGAERRLARAQGWITIATGTLAGEYFQLGEGLEAQLKTRRDGRGKRIEAQAVSTSGSAENCRLVNAGEAEFALAQNDIVHMAHHGTGLFERDVPLHDIRALCSLFPEAVQIVTLRTSGITTLPELRGKRINIGVEGSGMRINAIQVLKAAKLDLTEFAAVRGTSRYGAVRELKEGKVDAMFVTSAYPAPGVVKLAATHPIRLIPLPTAVADELHDRYPFFIPVRIPRNTYPDMEQDGLTVAVTAMLIAHKDTPDARVELVVETLFSDVETLTKGSLPAYYISPTQAKSGISIPMHPAAERLLARLK